MTEHLTDTEWTDVLATLPENPEAADGWELSLVRRTVERILAAREQALREQIAQDIEVYAKPQVNVIRNAMKHAARIARGAR